MNPAMAGTIGIIRRNPLGDLDTTLRIIQVQDQRDLRMTREFQPMLTCVNSSSLLFASLAFVSFLEMHLRC
jgi:hypothetical protein